MTTDPGLPVLKFSGSKYLVQRLVLATLTGRPVRISNIRASSSTAPGLAPHEVSFLRLLDALSNGAHIEFSYTGTTVLYKPGLLTGSGGSGSSSSNTTKHELPADCTRGASYFLLPLCILAPFAKTPINLLLTGPGVITSATPAGDVSVDTIRTAILPMLRGFGIIREIELRILRRANPPAAGGSSTGGEVQLLFAHQLRHPATLHLLAAGRVRRVRGVAYATGVSGAVNARLVDSARALLNPLVPDTYIFSDVGSAPRKPGGGKPTGLGFGLSLVAETTTGVFYSADEASSPAGGEAPEDIGRRCALRLLEVIEAGGCVDIVGAPALLTLMALGAQDVGRVTLGKTVLGSEAVVQLARDTRAFGLSGWAMKEGDEEHEAVVSIAGAGVGNVGRKIA